jgi:hypothetical protein
LVRFHEKHPEFGMRKENRNGNPSCTMVIWYFCAAARKKSQKKKIG